MSQSPEDPVAHTVTTATSPAPPSRSRARLADAGWLAVALLGVFLLWREVDDVGGLRASRARDLALSAGLAIGFIWPLYEGIAWVTRKWTPGRVIPPDERPRRDLVSVAFEGAFLAVGVVGVGLLGAYNIYFGVMAALGLAMAVTLNGLVRFAGPGLAALFGLLSGASLVFVGYSMVFFYSYGEDSAPGVGALLALLGPGARTIVQSARLAKRSWKIYRGPPRVDPPAEGDV